MNTQQEQNNSETSEEIVCITNQLTTPEEVRHIETKEDTEENPEKTKTQIKLVKQIIQNIQNEKEKLRTQVEYIKTDMIVLHQKKMEAIKQEHQTMEEHISSITEEMIALYLMTHTNTPLKNQNENTKTIEEARSHRCQWIIDTIHLYKEELTTPNNSTNHREEDATKEKQ